MNPLFETWCNEMLCRPSVVRRWLKYPVRRDDAIFSLKVLFNHIKKSPVRVRLFPESISLFAEESLGVPLCALVGQDLKVLNMMHTHASLIFKETKTLNVGGKRIYSKFKYDHRLALCRMDIVRACCLALMTSAAERNVLLGCCIVLGAALMDIGYDKFYTEEIPKMALVILSRRKSLTYY